MGSSAAAYLAAGDKLKKRAVTDAPNPETAPEVLCSSNRLNLGGREQRGGQIHRADRIGPLQCHGKLYEIAGVHPRFVRRALQASKHGMEKRLKAKIGMGMLTNSCSRRPLPAYE